MEGKSTMDRAPDCDNDTVETAWAGCLGIDSGALRLLIEVSREKPVGGGERLVSTSNPE